MVKVQIGNMFESKAQTLVNTVNCEGVMGKGVALEFKKRFPDMYSDYVARCEHGEVKLGQPYVYKSLSHPWILNFPTKDRWRMVTKLDDIVRGLEYLLVHYERWGIESLAVPPLGCGQGQLEWRVVGRTLYHYLTRMRIPVELYAPYGTPTLELQDEFLRDPQMPPPNWIKPAYIALVEILSRLEDQPYHRPVGHTIFQKIAYVATEEGLPTGLDYEQGSYGPFSPGMKKLETRLTNNGLISEKRLGRMMMISVGRTFEDARKTYAADLQRWEKIIERVTDLFMRMDTREAELITTVLYSARHLAKPKDNVVSEKDILYAVFDWKTRRKPPLEFTDVAYTIRNLAALGWLQVQASDDLPLPEEERLSA
jgi:O-acetyl-ADP-ribose deacetylase (regulator of RNase III)/uncharacterized protein YwgA